MKIDSTVMFNVPVRIDGVGQIIIGEKTIMGYPTAPCLGTGEILIQARTQTAEIKIGTNVISSNNLSLIAVNKISIGNDCLIGELVSIFDSDFHDSNPLTRRGGTVTIKPVSIGNNVWIGSRVMVLKGVTIGDNSVIAAGSIVTKTIPPNVIAGGNPARIIRAL